MSQLKTQLQLAFPFLNFKYAHSLAKYTYFKVGGAAEIFAKVKQRQQLINLVKFCYQHDLKLTVLGGASNVVVADQGVEGLVVFFAEANFAVVDSAMDQQRANQQPTIVRASAGIKTASLVHKTVEQSLTGLEYFMGVPGNLGGAIYNNAHYLDSLLSDCLTKVEVVDQTGQVYWLDQDQCEFAYDQSRFQHTNEIILQAELLLKTGDPKQIKQKIRQAAKYRTKTQPLGKPSSGCVFKNVKNTSRLKKIFPQFKDQEFVPAGYIIDQAGLKGVKCGDIEVSQKHAAFLVNNGQGSAAQIKQLIKQIKQEIKQKYQVRLQEEVFFIK